MKYFMTFCLVIFLGWYFWQDAGKPAASIPITVMVKNGDTLHDIILDLKGRYGDHRDWRVISWQTRRDNCLDKYIYPGQLITVRLEVPR